MVVHTLYIFCNHLSESVRRPKINNVPLQVHVRARSFINVRLLVLFKPPLQRFKRTIHPVMDAEVLTESVARHPLVSLVAACFWVIRAFSDVHYHLIVNCDVDNLVWLLSWAKSLVAFATITIPRFIYAVLSYSMTLTVRRLLLSLVNHSS